MCENSCRFRGLDAGCCGGEWLELEKQVGRYKAGPRLQAGFPWLQLESTGSFKNVLIKDHHSRPTNNTSDGRS